MSESRWYFTSEQIANSPSKRDGIDPEKEAYCRQGAARLIQEMGQRLQVTQLVINTAVVYVHRFYMHHSFSRFQRHLISPAALFLAAKIEEQPRKLELVIRIAHFTHERASLDLKSQLFAEKVKQMIFHENIILQTLGFDLAIDHPHTYVVNYFQSVRAQPLHMNEYAPQATESDIAKKAYYVATNSLHLTTLCLQYKPSLVACVCIYLVCKWNNYEQVDFIEGYQKIEPTCTMKMVENIAAELEKHQQFMKKLHNAAGSMANHDEDSTSKASKSSSDVINTAMTNNNNNNIEKSSSLKEHGQTSSSSKTVLTPKEYLDKKIKERIFQNRATEQQDKQSSSKLPISSDRPAVAKHNGSLMNMHHHKPKSQFPNPTPNIDASSNYRNIKPVLESSQSVARSFDASHKPQNTNLIPVQEMLVNNSEATLKAPKIQSESRHKSHKVNYLHNHKANKVSKSHSDSAHKTLKHHSEYVKNIPVVISESSRLASKSQSDAGTKLPFIKVDSVNDTFKTASDWNTKTPSINIVSTNKMSRGHSDLDMSSKIKYESANSTSRVQPDLDTVTPKIIYESANDSLKVRSELVNVTPNIKYESANDALRVQSDLDNVTPKIKYESANAVLRVHSDLDNVTPNIKYESANDALRVQSDLDTIIPKVKYESANNTLIVQSNLVDVTPEIKYDSTNRPTRGQSHLESVTPKITYENINNNTLMIQSDVTNPISKFNSESCYKTSRAQSDFDNITLKIDSKFSCKTSEVQSDMDNNCIINFEGFDGTPIGRVPSMLNLSVEMPKINSISVHKSSSQHSSSSKRIPKICSTDSGNLSAKLNLESHSKVHKIPSEYDRKTSRPHSSSSRKTYNDNSEVAFRIPKIQFSKDLSSIDSVVNIDNSTMNSLISNHNSSPAKLQILELSQTVIKNIHSYSGNSGTKIKIENSNYLAKSKSCHNSIKGHSDDYVTKMKSDYSQSRVNNEESLEKLPLSDLESISRTTNASLGSDHIITKNSSSTPQINSDSENVASNMKPNSGIANLISKIYSENGHKIRKSHSRSSHKLHKTNSESSHKISHLQENKDSGLLQPQQISILSQSDRQTSKHRSSHRTKSEVSSKHSSSDIQSDIVDPGARNIMYEKHNHRTNFDTKDSDRVINKVSLGLKVMQNDSKMMPEHAVHNVSLVKETNDVLHDSTSKCQLRDLSIKCEPKVDCKSVLPVIPKIENSFKINEVKSEICDNDKVEQSDVFKAKPVDTTSFNPFNFNSNFSFTRDVLNPSEKPPEDIFDTETDSKFTLSSLETASIPGRFTKSVTQFLIPEPPVKINESQALKSSNNMPKLSIKPTPLYSLVPTVQQSLLQPKMIGNESSLTHSHFKTIDPPMTTEQVHAYYRDLEARKLVEAKQDMGSDSKSSMTVKVDSSGTSKKREHKHKKHKKDRHGDKEHKKSKKSKSKKHKKDKHREKGEEPLPSIKISVFNNFYGPESLPTQSVGKQNNENNNAEQARIKLTIPLSRLQSNVTPMTSEETPKIKLKIPSDADRKSSKRSRDNSPDDEVRSSKRSRRSTSRSNSHCSDPTAKSSSSKSSNHYNHTTDSQQDLLCKPSDSSYHPSVTQSNKKIQIRHFPCSS